MHKVRNHDPTNRACNPKTIIQYTKHIIQNYQDQRVGTEPTILPEETETPVPVSDQLTLKPTVFQTRPCPGGTRTPRYPSGPTRQGFRHI